MYKLKIKKAFTLIELIFVIVIFAIISMFGADLYTKIYESYIQTRAMNQLEARTGNVLSMISSRLEDRIRGTEIGRIQTTNAFVPIRFVGETHDVLEWLGQSIESKSLVGNAATPGNSIGWSGFADLGSVAGLVRATAATAASFSFTTQGSHLNTAVNVIQNIKGNQNFAIIFRNIANSDPFLRDSFGYDGVNANNVAIANAANANTINVTNYPGRINPISGGLETKWSEQYYLTHSAYAIVPTPVDGTAHPQGGKVFDLELRYNYEPWNRQSYDDANTASAIIARDVSLFRFRDDNGAVAMKLCMRDNGRNLDPNRVDLIVCKSQVVY